jgi:hypothetical protein
MYSFRLAPGGRAAIEKVAGKRKETMAETVRAMLRYATEHMPENYLTKGNT